MHRVAAAIGLESMLFSLFPGDYRRAVAGSNPAAEIWARAAERWSTHPLSLISGPIDLELRFRPMS
jgi:hypothetical protein